MVALGSRGLNYDGWEAVTPWTSLELSFELLAFFIKMREVRAAPACIFRR